MKPSPPVAQLRKDARNEVQNRMRPRTKRASLAIARVKASKAAAVKAFRRKAQPEQREHASLADSVAAGVAAADAMATAIVASRERSAPIEEMIGDMIVETIAAPTAESASELQWSSARRVPQYRKRALDAITITVRRPGTSP